MVHLIRGCASFALGSGSTHGECSYIFFCPCRHRSRHCRVEHVRESLCASPVVFSSSPLFCVGGWGWSRGRGGDRYLCSSVCRCRHRDDFCVCVVLTFRTCRFARQRPSGCHLAVQSAHPQDECTEWQVACDILSRTRRNARRSPSHAQPSHQGSHL